jgi:hypothetical protein
VSVDAVPPIGESPHDVRDCWNKLMPEQQNNVTTNFPDRIGWLDDVPATSRDRANRITFENQKQQLLDRKAAYRDEALRLQYASPPQPARVAEVAAASQILISAGGAGRATGGRIRPTWWQRSGSVHQGRLASV